MLPISSSRLWRCSSRSAVSTSLLTLAAAGVIAMAPALAAEVVVGTGTTVSQQALNPNDTLTVQAGGTVSEPFDAVIDTAAGVLTIHNDGTIESTANSAVYLPNSSLTIDNSGSISGSLAAGQYGLYSHEISDLSNSGTISGFYAVAVATSVANLSNSGTISGVTVGVYSNASLGVVTNSGTIQGNYAVAANTSINSVVNTTSGKMLGTADGLIATDIGSIDNAGTIEGGANGVHSAVTIGRLTNSGTIKGVSDYGVFALDVTTLTNLTAGEITGGTIGIYAAGDIGTIDNAGTIEGGLGSGILAHGNIGSLKNSATGSIHGSMVAAGQAGVGAVGVIHNLDNAGRIEGYLAVATDAAANGIIENLNNTGTIQGTAIGVFTGGLLALTNSGTIAAASPAGYAIFELMPGLATDTVLNLKSGSVLIGHVDIHGGTNTLNVGPGLNLALTFDSSAPEVINSGSSAMTVIGNTVYVADVAAVAAAAGATANLSQGIAGLATSALDKGFDEKGVDGSGHFWLDAVGGIGSQPANNGGPAVRDGFAGFAVGADFGPDADSRFGGFAGAAYGRVENDIQTINSNNFYAGIYAGAQFDDYSFSGTLTAGTSHGTGTRVVANNTVATGLESFNGSGDSYFISPSLVLTKPWTTPGMSFETSLALNYTGVFAGAYGESAPTGMSIDAATTHVFTATGLVKLPMHNQTDSGLMSGDLHAGLEGRATLNPALNGTLAGIPVSFASANVAATAGIVAGGALTFEFDGGVKLFSGIDATLRTDASASAVGNVGIKGSF